MWPLRKAEECKTGAWRFVFPALMLALCFAEAANAPATFAYGPSKGDSVSKAGATANSNFAIADFDGDRKPDLATVEVQSAAPARNLRYSIRFKLSAGAAQSFGVTAPAGGLQILARDVNGDSFLDLLVTTAWQHQRVALFLNDGHGNFTLADPSAFPVTFRAAEAQWDATAAVSFESAILDRPESSAGKAGTERRSERRLRVVGIARLPELFCSRQSVLFSHFGRAPPLRA